MGMAQSVLQRRNLAFCISELSVTDKGIKKMTEMIKYVLFTSRTMYLCSFLHNF
jgi:hypothetical protein